MVQHHNKGYVLESSLNYVHFILHLLPNIPSEISIYFNVQHQLEKMYKYVLTISLNKIFPIESYPFLTCGFFIKQSIIYYTVRSPKLDHWLEDEAIQAGIEPSQAKSYIDLDPIFTSHLDEDFDGRLSGISRQSFCNVYLDWIQYCASRRDKV